MIHARRGTIAAAFTALLATQVGCHVMDFTPRYAEGEIDIFDDLFAVSVVDDQRVVVAGYHGTVYWTDDGGDSWHKGSTDTERLIYSMSMGSATHGWAVGQSGTILRTQDGGRTWRTQHNLKVEEGSHLFGVHAIDADTGWAVGEWGTRIHTTDGGTTWVDRSIPITLSHPQFVWLSISQQDKVRRGEMVYEDVGLNNIYCRPRPSTRCWIVGEFGYIFYSGDQGQTWERGSILGDVRVNPIELGFDEKIESLLQVRQQPLVRERDTLAAELENARTREAELSTKLLSRDREKMLHGLADGVIQADYFRDLDLRAKMDLKYDTDREGFYDEAGSTADEWFNRQLTNTPGWSMPSNGANARGGKGGKNSQNPFDSKSPAYSLTAQTEMMQSDPKHAEKLRAMANVGR